MTKETHPDISVVWFDLGFTLWNEERSWTDWAHWVGVPASDLFAVLGSVIERSEHHHQVFETFQPGIDMAHERELRKDVGQADEFRPEELYDDVIRHLSLRASNYRRGRRGRPREWDELLDALSRDLAPVGALEEILVENIAKCYWRERRALRCEAELIRRAYVRDSLALEK
jgi:hypothetical protein